MNKGTHFIGQPLYGQLINLLDKSKILGFSRDEGGEHYVKHFDGWQHLVVMLYVVIKRFYCSWLMQKRINRTWSFPGMATIVRIMLMYYINCYTFLE